MTSTIIQLVPEQARRLPVAALGPGLPAHLPKMRWSGLLQFWRRPKSRPFRIWHARRNVEMLPGILLRDALRMPLRLVFTSASQRRHTGYTRWLIGRMDAVIATSARSGAYLTVPHTVIHHGIDLARFRPHPGGAPAARTEVGLDSARRTVGCFGRVRHQKGTDLFVEAMIALLPHHSGWQAVVAGRATAEHVAFETELKRRVAAAGLSDRILFVGEHRDIERWYRALDLFVAPQRWEGFGLTPMEAMSCGVPVVAADVGVFSDVVTDGCGTIVPPDDLPALAAAIEPFLDDEPSRAQAADAALAKARAEFALAREADEIIAVYERLWASA
ncbi:glycosyltransferase family 4 protein [Aureimonas phyllosphaerae]|uniref:Mannosyltransferase n=1 Tax=Aureimonas phyllosphaerae TaxID=1166078 RepID=A0A7W6BPL3_9HYPH|nr:glycosyltransferase family 4 protein [Aureimonas phyllosphaerae]MBB3935764.1 mannosyltransferase [Aureimonas phyllosphaerae]MBB3959772.1 mannosyltransferase [Aureimonas phyllosphaerae]SFF14849.1 mannosyltransferase [Aureimonas phyllosphaerae]